MTTPEEYLESNGIKDKIVHVRHKLHRDINVWLSEVLADYEEYLKLHNETH